MPIIPTRLCWCLNTGESLGVTLLGKISVALFLRPSVAKPSGSSGLAGAESPRTASSAEPSAAGVLALSFGVQAMMNTPANVAAQPYRNVTISWKRAFWKSP